MQPDTIGGNKEYVQFGQSQVEKHYQTYGGITRVRQESELEKHFRERMEAAVSILERMIGRDVEEAILREMEMLAERAYRRKQNLMMAGMALEAIRSANGHMLEQDFTDISRGAIYKTPYGMVMLGVKEVLEKFWTGERA